ncbi:MAG: hypothetical protein A2758_03055 [Candidatus Zambryskibacteria bacterium RIFCSPHIGHO2_01_FULL_49_18]|uniref:Uncharacterized protein n=2 Tax=Candidatus Zambryskiibacteriota TaxID=1817925 RepID=A0A1G2T320_9BACT|nr:MAG: hypothetical protein A2758_03055 [Candidatus Zambryskibacteria bacterium RIFCSPHIGHO2_01_FULL_49_18]OHB05049.1 MAG: hypothetical protein A3A26_00550 [Candidatus Zambryskibacteria bacterium RIFCSPLOWO2_01_FULL_47_14]
MAKFNDVTVGQMEACINRMGGMENFLRFIGGAGELVFRLLSLVTREITVSSVSAREKFVVADHFKKGNAGIYYLGDNFKKWFGSKVEENVPAARLLSHQLTQSSVDGPIKAELGEGHETFLAWLFQMIEAQEDGREGALLVNGYANIFYIDGRVVGALVRRLRLGRVRLRGLEPACVARWYSRVLPQFPQVLGNCGSDASLNPVSRTLCSSGPWSASADQGPFVFSYIITLGLCVTGRSRLSRHGLKKLFSRVALVTACARVEKASYRGLLKHGNTYKIKLSLGLDEIETRSFARHSGSLLLH